MHTIYKYVLPIETSGSFELDMPRDAKVLTLQKQHGAPCIWALVDPSLRHEKRRFIAALTGEELSEEQLRRVTYIGTAQFNNGAYVVHLFEQLPT